MSEVPYYIGKPVPHLLISTKKKKINIGQFYKCAIQHLPPPKVRIERHSHNVHYPPNAGRGILLALFRSEVRDKHKELNAQTNTESPRFKIESTGPDDLFDSDGFRIPAVPLHRRVRCFNPEDSFASSDDEAPYNPPAPQNTTPQNTTTQNTAAQNTAVAQNTAAAQNTTGRGPFSWLSQRKSRAPEPVASLLSSDEETSNPSVPSSSNSAPCSAFRQTFRPPALRRETSIVFPLPADFVVHERQSSPDREADEPSPVPSRAFLDEDFDSESESEDFHPDEDEERYEEEEEYEEDSDDEREEESDDEDDSDYSPESDSDEDLVGDQDQGDKVRDIELYYLYTDSLRSVQSYPYTLETKPINTFSSLWIKSFYSSLPFIRRCFFSLMIAYLSFFLLIILLRFQNGYCDDLSQETLVDEDSTFFSFSSLFPSSCIPCPSRGNCENGILVCKDALVRRRPFYNLGGVLPISDICVHSAETASQIRGLERLIKYILSEKQGQLVYKEYKAHPRSSQLRPQNLASIVLSDFKEYIQTVIAEGTTGPEANEIFSEVLIRTLEDPNIFVWNKNYVEVIGTTMATLPKKYYALKMYYFLYTIYTWYILFIILSSATAFVAVKALTHCRDYKRKLEQIKDRVFTELTEQLQNHLRQPTHYASPSVPVDALRSNIIDIHDRQSLEDWNQVAAIMSRHPSVRLSMQEFMGEPVVCWELASESSIVPKKSIYQSIMSKIL
ncbi:unnamed protein product [Rhizopus stolonifer]